MSELHMIWTGIYGTHEEAIQHRGGPGFNSREWVLNESRKLQDFRASAATQRREFTSPPRQSLLPAVCSLIQPRTIIDLGGGSGWLYDVLKLSVDLQHLRSYLIIELPEVCDYFGPLHSAPVSYAITTDSGSTADILHVGSALQYIPDSNLHSLISEVRPNVVLIEDFFATDSPKFFTIQNYYSSQIIVEIRNYKHFISMMDGLLYSLVCDTTVLNPILGRIQPAPMDNFPEEFRVGYPRTLLFRRRFP